VTVIEDVASASLADRLAAYLQANDATITDISVTPVILDRNGYSNQNWFFNAAWTAGGVRQSTGFVVRAQVPGSEVFFNNDLFLQWHMMDALATHSDVPVPPLYLAERDTALIGRPFFVMGTVAGRVPANGHPGHHAVGWTTELSATERALMYRNALQMLARLHILDWHDGFGFLDRSNGSGDVLPRLLDHLQQSYEWAAKGRHFPVMETAMRWLRDRQPATAAACVTWGDARIGNIVFGEDLSVRAVLDWEMAEIAPPELDVVWWLMFEETRKKNASGKSFAGAPSRDETIALYESFSGRTLRDLDYFEILGRFRRLLCTIRIYCPNPDDDTTAMEANMRPLADLVGVPFAVTATGQPHP
jgi:aminoglycoside phosphotransferase (APT) family kinase protein